jgi:hypothetical protein
VKRRKQRLLVGITAGAYALAATAVGYLGGPYPLLLFVVVYTVASLIILFAWLEFGARPSSNPTDDLDVTSPELPVTPNPTVNTIRTFGDGPTASDVTVPHVHRAPKRRLACANCGRVDVLRNTKVGRLCFFCALEVEQKQ